MTDIADNAKMNEINCLSESLKLDFQNDNKNTNCAQLLLLQTMLL